MKTYHKYAHELKGSKAIYNYITGGHGAVTLQSDVTGIHHTYSFHAPDNRRPEEDTLFVYTCVGDDWIYVGMYKNKDFRLTAKSKFSKESAIVKGVAFILKLMLRDDYSDDRMHLFHEGVCCRCGRPLTNPTSIELGIGPKCAELGM